MIEATFVNMQNNSGKKKTVEVYCIHLTYHVNLDGNNMSLPYLFIERQHSHISDFT